MLNFKAVWILIKTLYLLTIYHRAICFDLLSVVSFPSSVVLYFEVHCVRPSENVHCGICEWRKSIIFFSSLHFGSSDNKKKGLCATNPTKWHVRPVKTQISPF